MGSNNISVDYLSAGANRQTAVADWSQHGILAFGSDINVAIWEPANTSPRGVSKLLGGHKQTVKALTFLPVKSEDTVQYLISGADDKALILWKAEAGSDDFRILHSVSEHTAPINCITALRSDAKNTSTSTWTIASGAADATIKIWSFDGSDLKLLQSIQTNPKFFPLSLALTSLDDDGDVFVLAAAGTRDTIQIFTADAKSEPDVEFAIQATLRGHEGWIRSLNFTKETASDATSDLLLASSSQDKYVRLWRLHQGKELPAAAAAGADPSSEAYMPGRSPANKAHWLVAAGKDFSITFEALLLGHEDWIYSARWHTQQPSGQLQLLSTSADNSLAIWEADPESGIWVSMVRLGEISREKGATTATGSTGGFWTGLWSPNGASVACLGRTGSWRRWEYDQSEDTWRPCVSISGHTKAVTGISWSKNGEYLLSTSSDQTTRLHTKWTSTNTWHEMSRPQIHGYDLNCIDSLGDSQFVSGADEKLMRVFGEPKAVASMLNRLAGIGNDKIDSMPDAANMPVLGLSNKAIDAIDDDAEIAPVDDRDRDAIDPASIVKKSHLDIHHPPFEETLSRHTLWPEIEKLYGHGYEISCLAASHDGTLIASACKASSLNHAVIRLFETERWTELRPPLAAHTLTAARLRFSSDDKYLLSVGRDRQWAVFERSSSMGRPPPVNGGEERAEFTLLQANPKGHSRMILDCAWAPNNAETSAVPRLFATAGRDKQVRVWAAGQPGEDGKPQFSQVATIPASVPVTAIDFLPRVVNNHYVLAMGTEDGHVSVVLVDINGLSATQLPLSEELYLPKAVIQLAWRPTQVISDSNNELAIAGDDGSLRFYTFSESYLENVSSSVV